jgi:serine/threonine-protein kinase
MPRPRIAFLTCLWFLPVAAVLISGPAAARAQDADAKLADDARAFFKTYCYECHGGPNDEGTRLTNVLDPEVLLAKPSNPKKRAFVVPDDPEKSEVWQRAGKAPYSMPKDYAERQPSEDERKIIERWIRAGAPFPKAGGRVPAFIDDAATLTAIRDHLRDSDKVKPADRPFQRYITLVHLYNNPTVQDDQIRIHRAAISKLLNSLSSMAEIAVPRPIDEPAQVILNFDLRAYGWSGRDWNEIEKAYVYGVLHTEDEALSEIEGEIARLTGT